MAKPRVMISTDIGGSDPDDMESMAHALLAADQWDIQGLISTPTGHGGRTSDIHKALDAYAKDYDTLKSWSSDYPSPDKLEGMVHQGSIDVAPSAGYSNATEGSQAIVDAAHDAKAAGEPLWVMTWGSLTDVAQALHDDPSIASTLRVLATSNWNRKQDPNAHDYVVDNHAKDGMWMIDSNSTFRGIYINDDGAEGNPFQMNEAKGHGALGDYFHESRPWGVKMGDSWSIAYLTDQANNANPGADSWGGTFVKDGTGANFWTDDPNDAVQVAGYEGAAHMRKHQPEIYNDMYDLFDRARAANPDQADDTPSPAPEETVDVSPDDGGSPSGDDGSDGGTETASPDENDGGTETASPAESGGGTETASPDESGGGTETASPDENDGGTEMASPDESDGGTGDDGGESTAATVVANDDWYTVDSGDSLWVNSRHFTANDSGQGALEVTDVDDSSANGGSVRWDSEGSMVYDGADGFSGTDTVGYTVAGRDGGTGRGELMINVVAASSTDAAPAPSPEETPAPASDGGSASAGNDWYHLDGGDTLWVNSRHFKTNDGGDGGVQVTGVDSSSANGGRISWGPEGSSKDGTTTYEAPDGFSGMDEFDYQIAAEDGSTDTGTVHVQVPELIG